MKEKGRDIPLPIQRQVRKECGFGCVICGLPLYDYDHIIEWAIVKEHKADNLALLCSQHHREKTNGLLTSEQIKQKRLSPYNLSKTLTEKYDLHFQGNEFSLEFGDMVFYRDNVNSEYDFLIPFLIDNKQLIGFEIIENQLFFNLLLFDRDNNLLLKIEQNRLVYRTEQWDVQFVGRNLKVREGHRKILLDIDFLIPNRVRVNKALFFYDKRELVIENGVFRAKRLRMGQKFSYSIKRIENIRIGIAFGYFDGKTPCQILVPDG